MNPQPFSSLNHLTVPAATVGLLDYFYFRNSGFGREPQRQPQPQRYLVRGCAHKRNYGFRMTVPEDPSSTIQPRFTSSSRSRSASAQFLATRAASRSTTRASLTSSTTSLRLCNESPNAPKSEVRD